MSIQEFNLPIFFNSAVDTGAVQVGNLGNEFSVQLYSPIIIPRDAINCTAEVSSASIWNSSPNISEFINNNKIHFTYSGVDYVIIFPDGLYGSTDMDSLVKIYFGTHGLPLDLFEITSNTATGRVVITFNLTDLTIDFSQPSACIDVLGFNPDVIGPYVTVPYYKTAPNLAKFNRVENYYLVSNLVSGGIPQNRTSSGILARIPIDVHSGSLINYNPTNPTRCNATELIGTARQVMKFRLLDQLLRDVSTFNEDYSFCINIRYYMKV
jgi:hypothetical protein